MPSTQSLPTKCWPSLYSASLINMLIFQILAPAAHLEHVDFILESLGQRVSLIFLRPFQFEFQVGSFNLLLVHFCLLLHLLSLPSTCQDSLYNLSCNFFFRLPACPANNLTFFLNLCLSFTP